ncbi:hypothetical protein F2Q69_00000508 [Brassica cretica]|uniref:Uncharacterized protein n=1 Tax=Brassica cretica TaxID=69181 RepID=A0A8S9P0S6_BRACR|nr:hypothetical protein F2Q69_00000508 [Brassica cretica]
MKAVKDKEKAIDGGEEDREKRSLMESGTKLGPGYMVINNGMIHYQSKSIKVRLHGEFIRVNKDTKSLDVGANLFIGNLDHASISLGGNGNFTLTYWLLYISHAAIECSHPNSNQVDDIMFLFLGVIEQKL